MKINNALARLTDADLAEASRRKAVEFSERMAWLRNKFGHLLKPKIQIQNGEKR